MERRPHAPVESARVEHGNPEQDPYAFACAMFAELAQTGLVRSSETDIASMAQIFWEGLHGMTSLRLVFGDDEPWFEHEECQAHLDTLMDVLMTGILKRFGR
jgi:hypothetical protein